MCEEVGRMEDRPDLLKCAIGEAEFCAVDVETSSLGPDSRLVEVGAVRFDLGGNRQDFQSLVNPCEPISPAATAIHGIDEHMVRNSPCAADVLPGLLNFMRGCVLMAHNATFDVSRIAREIMRTGGTPPGVPVLCTVRLSRSLLKGLKSYSLGNLTRSLGIETGELHNALPDAEAAARVFLRCIEGIPRDQPVGRLPGMLGWFDEVSPAVEKQEVHGNPEELELLAAERISIEMEYMKWSGPARVVVTPQYLFTGNGRLYLRAFCHRDRIRKTYRVDRIAGFRRFQG